MTTKYNISRRQFLRGMRTEQQYHRDMVSRFKSAVFIALCVALYVAVIAWMQERDENDKVQPAINAAKQAEQKAYALLAHAMNKGSIINKNSGAVFFFDVSKQDGL